MKGGRAAPARRVIAAVLLAAGATAAGAEAPRRPEPCRTVPPGGLAAALAEAPAGTALCLAPGDHPGPVAVGQPHVLWGPRDAVIRSSGQGTTVSLEAPGAALLGVTVDGSGGRFDLLDAAVAVRADGARVEGVHVRNALFGLLAEQVSEVVLRGNVIEGAPGKALGMRGDGIRLWEVRRSRVEDNVLRHSRDLVVWYSPGNRFAGNRIEHGRYGTHFMYSHDNVLEDNRYADNVVGVFAMYSRNLAIRRNVLARAGGAAGVGLGAKESGNLVVEDNWIVANHVGVYLDTSPLSRENVNRFRGNVFGLDDTAVLFHGGAARNVFEANAFRDNRFQVRTEGRGDARDARWHGNAWDDYAGYDLDEDGTGDLPYVLRSLEGELSARRPALAFFRGSPAMVLVELVGRVVPIFRPKVLLVDEAPRMRVPDPEVALAH